MEHNFFRLTLKCEVEPDIPARDAIDDHLRYTANLTSDGVSISDLIVIPITPLYLAYTKLITKDYGVAQTGIGLVNAWLRHTFTCTNDFGVVIHTVVVHPKANIATGARVHWDHDQNGLSIEEFEL